MKTAKRVLAILMAMLMAVSTFAVAASAAGSLQTAIDNAAAGATVSISMNTKESITVKKDITINLGGKILKSVEGKPAITVTNGAKVTITNGYVESFCENYDGGTEALKVLKEIGTCPSAIVAYGAGTKVTLDDVRAMGGLFRVPSMNDYYVPLGSAVKLYNSAELELNNAVLIGSYAVSNDPKGLGRADGKVIVKDAILIGFIDYIKRVYNGLVYDEATVEKVNAADRIVGFLNNGVSLTEGEAYWLDKALDDRIYIFTTKPTDDNAVVTIDRNTGFAKITAEEVVTEMGKTTDCCYKYIPENAYDAETGTKYELNTNIPAADVEGKNIRINYRLAFELKGDMKKYANNFDAYFNRAYELAIEMADAAVTRALNFYEYEIQQLANIYSTLDEAAAKQITIGNTTYSAASELGDDFYAIERGLLALGGVKLFNKSTAAKTAKLTTAAFEGDLYNGGVAAPAAGTYEIDESTGEPYYLEDENGNLVLDNDYEPIIAGYYYDLTSLGTLDKVDALINGFLAKKGSSFSVQANWDDMIQYAVNHYDELFDLLDEAEERLVAFKNTLTSGTVGEIVESLGLKSKISLLNTLIKNVQEAQKALDKADDFEMYNTVRAKVDSFKTEDDATVDTTIASYVRKATAAVNDYTRYFTPEDFLLEGGKFGKAYRVNGPTREVIKEVGKLNLVTAGGGTVSFVPDTQEAGVCSATTDYDAIAYTNYVTLTAVPNNGMEFMYWVNDETDRILSTDKSFVVDTQVKLFVRAVFEAEANGKVVLTNNSAVWYDTKDYVDGSASVSGVYAPMISGYEIVGWGPNGATETLTEADFTSSYSGGNSAFSGGAIYNSQGYAFKINSETQNKYLATSKYNAKSSFTVTFVDPEGETVQNDSVPFGRSTPVVTAQGENFSYWQDQDGNIVCLTPNYKIQATRDVTVTAVYGASDVPAYSMNIIGCNDTDASRITFYGERSVPGYAVVSQGFLFSCDPAVTEPEMADEAVNELVHKTYSTVNSQQAVAGFSFQRDLMEYDICYVRTYVEYKTATGTDYIYGNVYNYGG